MDDRSAKTNDVIEGRVNVGETVTENVFPSAPLGTPAGVGVKGLLIK